MDIPKKIDYIDSELEKVIEENSKIRQENLERDLTGLTDVEVKIIGRIDKIRRELGKVYKSYDKVYKEKYAYYTYKSDIVPSNEPEKISMIKADEEISEWTDLIKSYERDIKRLDELKTFFKQKYWNIAKIIEYRQFMAGK